MVGKCCLLAAGAAAENRQRIRYITVLPAGDGERPTGAPDAGALSSRAIFHHANLYAFPN